MNNYSKILAALVVAAFVAMAIPANAQTTSATFGSKVAFGDNDFVPTLAATAAPGAGAAGDVGFCQINLGDQSLVTDDGMYAIPLLAAAAVPATVPANAVRLTAVAGKAAGTLVADADTTEKGQGCIAASNLPTLTGAALAAGGGTLDIFFVSFDALAAYTAGDCVYLDRDNSATLTRWDIRLSTCMVGATSYAAGTLVELGDQDLVNGALLATAIGAAAQFAVWDSQPNAVFDGSDRLYLSGAATAQPGLNDIRLVGGTYGSKVAIGGGDFLPTLAAIPGGAVAFCQVNLGDQSLVTDDGMYLIFAAGAAAATVPANALRLTSAAGKTAGTLVADADTTEKGQACIDIDGVGAGFAAAGSTTVTYGIAGAAGAAQQSIFALSFDQIAAYTSGDCVYLNRDGSATAAPLSSLTRWDIRLNQCKVGTTTYNAGSLVELGDQDLVNNPGAIAVGPGAAVTKFYDSQPNGIVDSGDRVYASGLALAVAANPSVNDVRLMGTPFGGMVTIGNDDFIPTLAGLPGAVASLCRINLGDQSLVTDDGYYLINVGAGAGAVVSNAIRLVTVNGKAPGSMVGDSDTTEKGQACVGGYTAVAFVGAGATDIFALSFDQIAAYTGGDCVYMNRDASAGPLTRWDIRLTKCVVGSSTYNAGTLVELGDADLVNGAALATNIAAGGLRFWDAQPNAILDSMDRVYISSVAASTKPVVHDVRLIGDFTTATNPGGGGTSQTTSTSGTGTGTGTGSDTTTTTKNKTPGFELVALVGALGAALVLVRRKL